jgi:hypothetical protein
MMSAPQREGDLPNEPARKTNVIELNTIKAAPRRMPYVFKVEAPELPVTLPYVFKEEPAAAEAQGSAGPQSPVPSVWDDAMEGLRRAEAPDDVSRALAALLAEIEGVLRRKQERALRFAPRGLAMLPPACVALSLALGSTGLTTVAHGMGLPALAALAPWLAVLAAVPTGLTLSSILLRRVFRSAAPQDRIRLGAATGTILEVRHLAWLVDLEGAGRRVLPYYLAVYCGAGRVAMPSDED